MLGSTGRWLVSQPSTDHLMGLLTVGRRANGSGKGLPYFCRAAASSTSVHVVTPPLSIVMVLNRLVFMYGSDENPPVNVESMFLSVFKSQSWPAAHIAAASKRNSSITGPTGVKMAGPYAWVVPGYQHQQLC